MAPVITPAPAADRRSALAATRGTVLAAHAAAGIACPVDREVVRLLRCCEGLARAAAARLEHLGRLPRAPLDPPGDRPGASAAPSGVQPRANALDVADVAAAAAAEAPKRKRPRRKKRVKKDAPMAVASGDLIDDLGDAWADDLPVQIGPAPNPDTAASAAGTSALAPGPRRQLRGRPSRERTPPPRLSSARVWMPGDTPARLDGLAQQDLNGHVVDVLSFNSGALRWEVRDRHTKKTFRVKAVNIVPLEPSVL